jgi:arginyl-tRNA synthetase
MKEAIAKVLVKKIDLKKEEILSLIEIPPEMQLGDFAFPCFVLAKSMKKAPGEIAKALSEKLSKNLPEGISELKAEGPYLNFFTDKTKLVEKVLESVKEDDWGRSKIKNQKIMIEFSQPNTHKAFHVGHIRGTSLGESIARISEFFGNKTIRANYSGDTGMHIAKWIWCYKNFHEEEGLKEEESWIASIYVDAVKRLEKNPEAQKEVNKINNHIEKKDNKVINSLWEKTRKLSIRSWDKIYLELGTHFDRQYFESEVELPGKEIALKLLEKKIAKKSEGAVIMNFRKDNLGVFVLLRSDGTVLYSAKDIALAKLKSKDYNCDKHITTIGDEQKHHGEQVVKTLKKMKFSNAKNYLFLPFGMVRLSTGKMSSRTGDNILYSDFMKEITDYTKERISEKSMKVSKKEIEKRALKVSVAAIKYSMLKQDPRKVIIFDKKEALKFEGDTGPYLLYSYARASSILRKVKSKAKIKIKNLEDGEVALVKKIDDFPSVVENAYTHLAPNLIANYSYELSQIFNEFYHSCPVMGSEKESFRLKLVDSFRKTLKKSLELLGIETLEEM